MSDDFDLSWITAFADRAEVDHLDAATVDALLNLAGHAARDSGDRRNAPLSTFLAGYALGLSDLRPDTGRVDGFR